MTCGACGKCFPVQGHGRCSFSCPGCQTIFIAELGGGTASHPAPAVMPPPVPAAAASAATSASLSVPAGRRSTPAGGPSPTVSTSQRKHPESHLSAPKAALPKYWTTQEEEDRRGSDSSHSQRVVVSQGDREAMQALFDGTWSSVRTRDRPGSEKVSKLEVVQVLRNENAELWHKYACRRGKIAADCQKLREFRPWETRTRQLAQQNATAGRLFDHEDLLEGANEFLLFHGSSPAAMDAICENNFKEQLADTAGLFGGGLYFAEKSSKADEYACDDTEGIYRGLYGMLICRVTCGSCFYSDAARPDVPELLSKVQSKGSGPFHSVLGDREKVRGTYREFVVYDRDQVYPEYVVIYRRSEDA